jgi:anti-anti-sigma factor
MPRNNEKPLYGRPGTVRSYRWPPRPEVRCIFSEEISMSTIEIRTRLVEGAAVVYPGPYLNQLRGERIERRCLEMLDSGIRNLVINFEETELVNSIGVSLLLGVIEAVDETDGKVILTNLSSSNRELFEVLGILSKVEVLGTEEIALARVSGRPEATPGLETP